MSAHGRVSKQLDLVSLVLVLTAGCATYKPLPETYLHPPHSAVVVMAGIPHHPLMMDSSQGGLVGALITATSRASRMREQLAGIDGQQVQSVLMEQFKHELGEHLQLDTTNQDLRIEVTVDVWGWYVPTISFGIKVGEYQSQLVGRVAAFDPVQNKKVAFARLQIQRPIGLKPEPESARAAVDDMARAFAEAAEQALVHSVKPPPVQ